MLKKEQNSLQTLLYHNLGIYQNKPNIAINKNKIKMTGGQGMPITMIITINKETSRLILHKLICWDKRCKTSPNKCIHKDYKRNTFSKISVYIHFIETYTCLLSHATLKPQSLINTKEREILEIKLLICCDWS